jgi:uncharacterized membrane protein YgdD (TMEM256/DUF423 family)
MKRRLVPALAAVFCALSVALAAYAAHAAEGLAKQRLAIAAAFFFGHGLALLVLRLREGRLALAARIGFLAGTLCFAGSLARAALFGGPTFLAPIGGTLLIAAWLLTAVDFLRRE